MNDIEIQIDYCKRINEKLKEIEKQKKERKKDEQNCSQTFKLKYYILTMGCKLNENDSEKISGMLENMGYVKTENQDEANVVVFNTCCIRENAEEKLFGKIGELKNIKQKNDMIIAIGGCMMQQEHISKKLKESYPYIDIKFGTHTLHKLPENIFKILERKKKIQDIIDIDGKIYEGLPLKRDSKVQATIPIMNGCNNFCSFCIVPYVRGRERSRLPKDILQEVEDVAKQGYKEVMLVGQNVNSYLRIEREKNIEFEQYKGINSFATLLEQIAKIEAIERIRFISPHPKDFTDDVIEQIAKNEKICKSIHLPLQSGNTRVLKTMNRKYTKDGYMALVEKMKNKIPNLALSTDIIVGFPGETDEEFEDTLDVVDKVNYDQVYMFIYSRRVGTPGDKMEKQVPEDIKHKRFDKLKKLVDSQVSDNNIKYVGTTQKVLVEGFSKNNKNTLTGRTDTNKSVIFEGKEDLIGQIIEIKIVSEHKWYLKGEINGN